MARIIGIRHRVKKTAKGEARPTQVVIVTESETKLYDLDDETAELDFVLGRLPVTYREAKEGEDLSSFIARHVKRKELEGGKERVSVPSAYEGLRAGDTVAMVLGGSGDNLAFALSRRAEEVGAKVLRLPPYVLNERRAEDDKDRDAELLAGMAEREPNLFYEVRPRDRDLIKVRETFRSRMEVMRARIACEQRLRQHMVGVIFRSEEGKYPEGTIEEAFDKEKASDVILVALEQEEKKRAKELERACEKLDVYREVFSKVEGCGPAIAARIISSVVDIRSFAHKAKFKAFCGVHVGEGGKFVRRRSGTVANWSPEARQAFYLFAADQCNKRPNSVWGKKLREYKAKFRAKHPEPIVVEGKKRYTDGHIHKMAIWRTATKFAEWLFKEWMRLEKDRVPASEKVALRATG